MLMIFKKSNFKEQPFVSYNEYSEILIQFNVYVLNWEKGKRQFTFKIK